MPLTPNPPPPTGDEYELAVTQLATLLTGNVRTSADVLGVDAAELLRNVCTRAIEAMPLPS